MFDALRADAPAFAAADDLYGSLLGSWTGEAVDHKEDGDHRTAVEIHFARVLGGRAIQDVWIAPERGTHGTTLRVFDPQSKNWRVTWINPARGVECRLVGRREGADIVQEGRDDDGSLMRWCFREMTPESFHWTGERSRDGGKTVVMETEFFAIRAAASK
jgi:hypothetical protein